MKASSCLVYFLQGFPLTVSAVSTCSSASKCSLDKCGRAATGSAGLASCSSFQACTVTMATTTAYTAKTVTLTQPDYTFTTAVTTVTRVVVVNSTVVLNVNQKRATTTSAKATTAATGRVTSCPTAIPKKASGACSASSQYASACSCAGVTKSYTTTAAHTVTNTLYYTRTAPPKTRTVSATAYRNVTSVAVQTVRPTQSSDFMLQLEGDHPYDGYFLYFFRQGRGDPGPLPVAASTFRDSQTGVFSLNDQMQLKAYGFTAGIDSRQGSSIVRGYYNPGTGYTFLTCQLLNTTPKSLYCYIGDDRTAFYICPPGRLSGSGLPDLPILELGNGANVDGCYFTTVRVAPNQV